MAPSYDVQKLETHRPLPAAAGRGVVLGLVLGQYLGRNTTTSQLKGMLSRMALPDNKLSYTLSLIENQYVDSVSMDSLAEHVIPMLVKELDPIRSISPPRKCRL